MDPLPPLPGRRVVSEGPPVSLGGFAPLPEAPQVKPPQPIEDRSAEAKRVVKRLLALIADHHQSASRIDVELDAAALHSVVLALEAESRGENPSSHLQTGGELIRYVKNALYEELLEEPSNILFTTRVNAEVTRYEAMEVAFWRECLAELRRQLGI